MATGEPANGSGNGRLALDRRISVGSLIQLVVMVLGGLWILAQLQADVTAEREQLGALASQMAQLRGDLNATVARLDSRMDMLRDRSDGAR